MVTPKLDEGEYKSEYRDEPVEKSVRPAEGNVNAEPSSSNIKPEEPSSTTSPSVQLCDTAIDSEHQNKPDSATSNSDAVKTNDNSVTSEPVKQQSVMDPATSSSASHPPTSSVVTASPHHSESSNAPSNAKPGQMPPSVTPGGPPGMPPGMPPSHQMPGSGYQGSFGPRMPMHPGMQMPPGPYGPQGMPPMGPNGPIGPVGPMGPNGPMMPMRPEGPIGPDGHMMRMPGPIGHPMDGQMGMNHGIMRPGMPPMHPGMRMPMGPQGMMPPPHPIQMEMQHLHQQLNHLYNQPQNPQIQQQVRIIFKTFFNSIKRGSILKRKLNWPQILKSNNYCTYSVKGEMFNSYFQRLFASKNCGQVLLLLYKTFRIYLFLRASSSGAQKSMLQFEYYSCNVFYTNRSFNLNNFYLVTSYL